MTSFFVVVELLRSKDNDLRKILDEKSKLVAELRVKKSSCMYFIKLLVLVNLTVPFLSAC